MPVEAILIARLISYAILLLLTWFQFPVQFVLPEQSDGNLIVVYLKRA